MYQVECVGRTQGLMVAPGNPLGLRGFGDIARPGVRYVNRQKGSGTRILADYLCKKEGVDPGAVYGYGREEFTHTAVAAQIAGGTADAGMGICSAAKIYGLDFLPVCVEQYDLIIPIMPGTTPWSAVCWNSWRSRPSASAWKSWGAIPWIGRGGCAVFTEARLDAVVLGGGLLGCFAARHLTSYRLRCGLVEAREDVCTGISRGNSAIIYTGYDNKPNTRKARLCVQANRDFPRLCAQLGVPFARRGSLLVSYGPRGDEVVRRKYGQGLENGVEGLELLTGAQAMALEPDWPRGFLRPF